MDEKMEILEIELTNYCNLKCNMCDIWQLPFIDRENKEFFEKGSTLEEDPLEKWIEYYAERKEIWNAEEIERIMQQAEELGAKEVILTGGEPTYHEQILEIVEILNQQNVEKTLITNGTLLDKDLAEKLAEGGWRVNISLDGSRKEVHESIRGKSFKKTLRGLKEILKKQKEEGKGRTNLHFVAQDKNIENIPAFLKFCWQLRLRAKITLAVGHKRGFITEKGYSKLVKVFQKIQGIEGIENVIPVLKPVLEGRIRKKDILDGVPFRKMLEENRYCKVPEKQMVINAFGDAYPCCNIQNPSNCMGNVEKQNLREIWTGEKYQEFRGKVNPINPEMDEMISCGECEEMMQK